jgi:ketosteroid isomerase-like protein
MNKLKTIFTLILISLAVLSCYEKRPQLAEETKISNEEIVDVSKEKEAVVTVMKLYKDAIQSLTTDGTFELFTTNATIFEQGKVEGTYKDYIEGHLGPELGHFKSFTFSDYEIDTTVNMPYAYTTETYLYTIVLKGDKATGVEERTIESKGVATSILEKIDGKWKIIHSHTSFKKLNQ